MNPTIHESQVEFLNGDDANPLVIRRSQEITDDFLSDLSDRRTASANRRLGEFELAASIPVAVHENWLRQGYDCTKEPVRETMKRLRLENLGAFIATNRRF